MCNSEKVEEPRTLEDSYLKNENIRIFLERESFRHFMKAKEAEAPSEIEEFL